MAKKILIIEDDADISQAVSFRLTHAGYSVIASADGQEGLEVFFVEKPDLVILDLMLPHLKGEEICRRIRKHADLGRTPIIMLTAKASDVDRVVGRVIGADMYMAKPYQAEALLAGIEKLLA